MHNHKIKLVCAYIHTCSVWTVMNEIWHSFPSGEQNTSAGRRLFISFISRNERTMTFLTFILLYCFKMDTLFPFLQDTHCSK